MAVGVTRGICEKEKRIRRDDRIGEKGVAGVFFIFFKVPKRKGRCESSV